MTLDGLPLRDDFDAPMVADGRRMLESPNDVRHIAIGYARRDEVIGQHVRVPSGDPPGANGRDR